MITNFILENRLLLKLASSYYTIALAILAASIVPVCRFEEFAARESLPFGRYGLFGGPLALPLPS